MSLIGTGKCYVIGNQRPGLELVHAMPFENPRPGLELAHNMPLEIHVLVWNWHILCHRKSISWVGTGT